jgi:hypothetical protein
MSTWSFRVFETKSEIAMHSVNLAPCWKPPIFFKVPLGASDAAVDGDGEVAGLLAAAAVWAAAVVAFCLSMQVFDDFAQWLI